MWRQNLIFFRTIRPPDRSSRLVVGGLQAWLNLL
jgi:hypothetical protein